MISEMSLDDLLDNYWAFSWALLNVRKNDPEWCRWFTEDELEELMEDILDELDRRGIDLWTEQPFSFA